jgi:hypothetical protein
MTRVDDLSRSFLAPMKGAALDQDSTLVTVVEGQAFVSGDVGGMIVEDNLVAAGAG